MKLLIFNPRPNEHEEVLLDHLFVTKEWLEGAMKLTSSLLVHKDYINYKALHPIFSGIYNWKVSKDAYSFKPLTVVAYYDED